MSLSRGGGWEGGEGGSGVVPGSGIGDCRVGRGGRGGVSVVRGAGGVVGEFEYGGAAVCGVSGCVCV